MIMKSAPDPSSGEPTVGFIGHYEKPVDEKSRMIVPSKFRKPLRSQELILTRWFDGALALFPVDNWSQMAVAISRRPLYSPQERNMRLTFFSSAVPQTMDNQGRVALNEDMKEFAGIESKVVLLGDWDKIQIWSHYRYRDFRKTNDVSLDEEYEKVLASLAGGQPAGMGAETAASPVVPGGGGHPTEDDET